MKNIFFTSLGCPRNLVDSETMIGMLLQNNFQLTNQVEEADFCIVNTCGFLKEAREEAYLVLQDIFALKKAKAKVIVCGCMVENFKDEIKEKFPQIFYFLGSGNVEDILKAVKAKEKGFIIDKKSYLGKKEDPRFLSTPKNYAYLKIAEGCLKNCSYCLIPQIKGPLKSKPIDQVVEEFKTLLKKGVFEIILIAQDLGDYGRDLKEERGLEKLLKELLKIKKEFKIRLLYLYPDRITDELIELIKSEERIYKYLDIPIQHVNDEILKKMKRKTFKEQIYKTIEKLRKEIKGIVIRTTLMVGFPSETEKQFLELLAFVKKYELDHVGVFKFSQEEGIQASKMEAQIEEKVKDLRQKKIYEIQEAIVEKKNRKKIGQKIKAFIEGYHPDSDLLLQARASFQAPSVDPMIIVNENLELFKGFNKPYILEITGFVKHDLIGKIVK